MRPMQLAGAAYMAWLGWGFLKADDPEGAETTAQTSTLMSGALVLFLNPKAYLIVALTLAQFAQGAQTLAYVVLVGLIILATYALAFALWAGASIGVGRRLGTRQLNPVYALSIFAAAIWTGWEALGL